MFKCNLPPALLAECPESFACHCGDTGLERTPYKSQHTKLTPEKKILPPLLPDPNSTPFDHESGALINKLSRLFVWGPLKALTPPEPDPLLQTNTCKCYRKHFRQLSDVYRERGLRTFPVHPSRGLLNNVGMIPRLKQPSCFCSPHSVTICG